MTGQRVYMRPTYKTFRGLPANRWQRKVLNSAYFVNVKIKSILVMVMIDETHTWYLKIDYIRRLGCLTFSCTTIFEFSYLLPYSSELRT